MENMLKEFQTSFIPIIECEAEKKQLDRRQIKIELTNEMTYAQALFQN